MANLFQDKKMVIALSVIALLVLFLLYTLIPSGLPKPFTVHVAGSGLEPEVVRTAVPQQQPQAPVVYPKVGEGIMYDTGPRVVNLSDPVGRRYLKINVVIEFLPTDYAYYQLPEAEQAQARERIIASIDRRKPLIDDMLTSLLTSESYESIYNLEGKNRLRAEIQERLNHLLGEPHVVAVYFTDFIIQ